MPEKILDDISHRRYNPLTDSWLLVSPHRTKRPWQGQQEAAVANTLPEYDPKCYLCPGNPRAAGDTNPQYEKTFAFVNDYSAVKEQQPDYESQGKADDDLESTLLRATGVKGVCYVLTFSPTHCLTLADMSGKDILPVVEHWTRIYANHLSASSPLAELIPKLNLSLGHDDAPVPKDQYRYMQIFENKGAAMGCSNPHPHCQVWTTSTMPEEPGKELAQMTKYRAEHDGRHLLADYVKLELAKEERIVWQNDAFVVICPWWAIWPFEVIIIAKRHIRSLLDFTDAERLQFADAIQEVTRRYDNLFECNFPYSSGIHQAPLKGTQEEIDNSYFHMHFYPPLLRSASVKKFLVGYELMAEPQRDITPEQATLRLRNCAGELYRNKLSEKS
ncbi:Galactose-1-phosphate uridylyltransferase-like protein [Hapsidospora chrysogenum ATCC 11550]|uniref:Galactose-1-phosphate uridylyltransferase n=1 Tax=Hapsidospora chrysogenum (strain ATCC 11550 / CBS 779.69 / DSM 880 / IAM 14645 / JCM 23072 / IMI 49137) TaxID=857340 RepID=A0A086T7F0_HAPC1|nr:Galactose-1-phosphate uridylyltransferase-like protein [Hapsidospora chrysogenum ATCC 11550]